MNINFENGTIEMTKAEAKEAGKFNSEKYIELKEIRSEFRLCIISNFQHNDLPLHLSHCINTKR